jgi:uncharacterized protein (TIGR03437 family)
MHPEQQFLALSHFTDSPLPSNPAAPPFYNVYLMRLSSVVTVVSALCTIPLLAQPRTAVITVNPDGTFTPQITNIRSGDSVRWEKLSRTDSIIPVTSSTYPAMCSARRPFSITDANEFTGPMPFAPSGVFTLSPLGGGFVETSASTCPSGSRQLYQGDNGKILCSEPGPYEATMDSTWRSEHVTGVFIRLLWKDVQPTATTYDFSVLQREMDKAVANGKLYSIGIKAGDDGTPDWIFSSNADGSGRTSGGGGVPRLKLQDPGDDTSASCGNKMDLGGPYQAKYKQLYFAMLTEMARVVKTRSDWFRALAYLKVSGANLVSHENRLPNTCSKQCPCNTQIFSLDGYRPSGLYAFYDEQNALLRSLFPGKPISYALIQDGFPRINETGGFETVTGSSSDASPLPGGTEQTQANLDRGQANHGINFVVQHNGLQPKRSACNLEGIHPKPNLPLDGYWPIGGGCPNRWVVKEGAEGQITGYQTTNRASVNTTADLDSAFQNMWDNTDSVFLEIYEELLWLADNNKAGVLPTSGKTVGGWADDLHKRRIDAIYSNFTKAGNPFPTSYTFTFNRTNQTGAQQTFYFVHGSKCGQGKQEWGAIVVEADPPAIKLNGVTSVTDFGGPTSAAPGTWIEIRGTNLAATTRQWAGTDFVGANAPTTLDGTSARIAGQNAFLSYISPTQINVQVPTTVAAGAQPLIVTTPSGSSTAYTLDVKSVLPLLFAPSSFSLGGRQYVAALFPDQAFVLPPNSIPGVASRRARPGDTITLYGVGFGPVTPAIPAGQIVSQSNTVTLPLVVNFGQTRATTVYSGLAPSQVGLYQFNVVVPQVAASDAVPLSFTLNGIPGTQTLVIPIQN